MLARAAHCHPPCTVFRHAWRSQTASCPQSRRTCTGPRSPCSQVSGRQALPADSLDSRGLGALSEDILRRQRIINEQLAELREITGRLTPEEQKNLATAIKQNDADTLEQDEQVEEGVGYPKPVRDILEAAGVLDAVPYSPEPVLAGASKVPLPRPLSYEWSDEDFVDDGQQLSDEEWAEFLQTQLAHVRKEAAGHAEGSGDDGADPDDPFHGLPDPFDDDLSMPGVRLCNLADLGASPQSLAHDPRADDIPFEPGEGVEEFLQLLEAGKPLPPDAQQIGRPKESAQSFLRRMDALQARYDAQFLKRKDWQISPEEVKALDAQWGEVAMRSDVPITMDDIQEVTPAPDIPPEVERQFKRLEWITYRLRRAYLEGTPSQPVQALASAGLLAEDAIYRDIVMECRGLPAAMGYANRINWTHGHLELCQIWGHMSEHRPLPEWYVMVDSWLNIPYPDWYLDYVRVHFQAARFPDAFMAAFANAAQSGDERLEEVLEQYRHWGERVRGVPRNRRERKQLERPVLWRDAYADRPFTNQQRLRSGTLPVLERNPAVTIDDTDALGSPEDILKDPFLDTRAADFVTDPAKCRPRFAGVAEKPYGSGRHLLLPLLRRMQQGGSRTISLAQSYQRSAISAPLQHLSSAAAQGAAAASSRLGSSASHRSAPADLSLPGELHGDADAAAAAAAEHAASTAQPSNDAWGSSAKRSAPEATDHTAARHSISTEDALHASRAMANDWAAGRLSLDYPPDEDDRDSVADEPTPKQSSMQGASSAAVLHMVMSSLRQVKPGIMLSTQLPATFDAATLEEQLSRKLAGDAAAAEALAALRYRGIFAGRERPKPDMPKPWQQTLAAAAGRPFNIDAPSHTVHLSLESWRHACQVAPSASSAPAGASDTPLSAPGTATEAGTFAEASAAHSARIATASSTKSSRAGLKWRPVPLWHRWHVRQRKAQKRTLEASKALPPLKHTRAARLPTAPASAGSSGANLRHVDAVVEAASGFFSSARSTKAEQDHTFRLLAYAPIGRDNRRAHDQQGSAAQSFSRSNPEVGQRSSSTQQEEPASSRKAAESKPVSSRQQSSGPPRQIPDTGKRLSFQWGSGFAPDNIRKPNQKGDIPDLVSLMCSASSDGTQAEGNLPTLTDGEGAAEADTSGTEGRAQSKGKLPGRVGDAPRKRPLGTAWRDGSHMTIPMTTMYELNPATGQVDRITSHWNGYIMHGLGGAEQEAWDIYNRQTRLYELMGRPGCSVRYVRRNMRPINPEVALDL